MWTVILVIVLIFIVILYLFNYSIHHTRDGILFNKIPGPKPLPVIGNILDFFHGPVPLFYQARNYSNKFKNISAQTGGNIRMVNVSNPEDIEILLSSPKYIKKGILYNFLHPWLHEGLLTSSGEKWQKRRKILTPAFHFNILKGFCKTFSEQSERVVQKIRNEIDRNQANVVPLVTQYTLNTISETAMGKSMDSKTNTIEDYKKAVYEFGKSGAYRLVRLWLFPDFAFGLTSMGRQQVKTVSKLHKFTTDVIQDRRETVSFAELEGMDSGNYCTNNDVKGTKRRLAMLDLLLLAESKGSIDKLGVCEEVDTFMFVGHDTTAAALSFALLLLANNRDAQELAAAEISEIVGDSTAPITIEDLHKMKYLERCIKEALRLYPSVPFISREIQEEVQLKDYLVPANTFYHIHIFDLHRSASIYPAPDVFDPDRFLLENCSKRHPFAYIPFSAGPRNCIGQKYAMLQEKSALASILRNFILEPITTPEDIIFSADLVLRCKDPIMMKFIPR